MSHSSKISLADRLSTIAPVVTLLGAVGLLMFWMVNSDYPTAEGAPQLKALHAAARALIVVPIYREKGAEVKVW